MNAVRRAPKGSSPGPSGLLAEHLWALGDAGRASLVVVVRLLSGGAAVDRKPAIATHALAGADLLLLVKPGGHAADGLPRLRPMGMPEVIRKLAASALAATVRASAATLFAPWQLGVGTPNACERILHRLEAHLGGHPSHAALQLDFRNAFNLVSRAAARAVIDRALPLLSAYFEWVYGGAAPDVYGWAEAPPVHPSDASPPPGPPKRQIIKAGRGAQQGDPLGPLMHAAALYLLLRRLAAAFPDHVLQAYHDDV